MMIKLSTIIALLLPSKLCYQNSFNGSISIFNFAVRRFNQKRGASVPKKSLQSSSSTAELMVVFFVKVINTDKLISYVQLLLREK